MTSIKPDNKILAIVACCVALITSAFFLAGTTPEEPERPERLPIAVQRLGVPGPAEHGLAFAEVVIPAEYSSALVAGLELSASDDLIRSLVTELSSHPKLVALLVSDNLVRRFVAAVDAIAGGYSPREELDILRPGRPFVVRQEAESLVIGASSFRRYNLAAELFASVDTADAVALYRELSPLIDEAHEEIPWNCPDFDVRLREAMDHLLEVSVPAGPIEVNPGLLTYTFADEEMERLSDAQRHLLRMGSANARKVQAKLREFRDALGWSGSGPDPGAAMRAELAEQAAAPEESLARVAAEESAAASEAARIAEVTQLAEQLSHSAASR